jgi:putative Holliday junction resolvase
MIVYGIDFGSVRVGLAEADMSIKIARPLKTLDNDETLLNKLNELIRQNAVEQVVVGLPRSLEAEETPQTEIVRRFAERLESELGVGVTLQDEALTSEEAERRLRQHYSGKIEPGRIDQEAAAIILQDYLDTL